jgi:hypothetical protein
LINQWGDELLSVGLMLAQIPVISSGDLLAHEANVGDAGVFPLDRSCSQIVSS